MKHDNESPKTKILTIPNLLSCFRIALIPVIVWLYFGKQAPLLTGCTLILSGLTDLIDGYIARKYNMVSDLGKILDPIADKLTQATMLICLSLRFPRMILPFVLMFIKEIFMSVTGFWVVRKKGVVLGAVWHGKVATWLLYGMMVLHVFRPDLSSAVSGATIAASSLMIALSLVLYGIRNFKMLQN